MIVLIVIAALIFATSVAPLCLADDTLVRSNVTTMVQNNRSRLYWNVEPVAGTAQLVTLFCQGCAPSVQGGGLGQDLPLISVLRDTLGNDNRDIAVWLLNYANPGLGKKMLSALPFFYWHPGSGTNSSSNKDPKPLLDLTAPQHPVLTEAGRNVLQWTALDPMMMPVRASSRTYRANGLDDERLHLETAISYLRSAPVSEEQWGLTESERNLVIARLELRKRLLGGLVSQKRALNMGEQSGFEEERIRSRNWELLRQLAEKTGLIFQPLDIANTHDEYGMLSFPLGQPVPATGTDLKPIWKLLSIRNPWTDERFRAGRDTTSRQIPLAVYSLTYPKLPLLLVDFRDQVHLRRHEMAQRSINEITAGVIGISHFTNWYYYLGADLYDFVSGRHGAAIDQSERLDAYSRLRIDLALDQRLEPAFRKSIKERLENISVNPLQAGTDLELRNAMVRYERIQSEVGADGKLASLLDKRRRAELARFGKSNGELQRSELLHLATFGVYKDCVPTASDNLAQLRIHRRVTYNLNFLDQLTAEGTLPEVNVRADKIQDSVAELSSLVPKVQSNAVRDHALATLDKLKKISRSPELQSKCTGAIAILNGRRPPEQSPAGSSGTVISALIAAQDSDK